MTRLLELVLLVVVLMLGRIAYLLCFTDHTLGGYLPAFFITVMPVVAFFMGKWHSDIQAEDDDMFARSVETKVRSEFRAHPSLKYPPL